jgi:hypothetical protein
MDKRKKAKPMANSAARALVVQAYWNKDQELKQVQAARSNLHDLTLLAVPLGDTAGPATDAEGMPHWLTHGERELVAMDAGAVYDAFRDIHIGIDTILQVLSVDMGKLRERWPGIYLKVLKHRSTRRATHSCLTWSDKRPRPVRKRPSRTRHV